MADDAPPPPPATVQRGGRGRGRGGKGGRARGRGGKGRGRGKGRRDDDAPSDGDDEVKEAEPGDRGRGGTGKGRAKTFGRGAGAPAEPAAPAELPYGGDIQAAMRAQDRDAIRALMAAQADRKPEAPRASPKAKKKPPKKKAGTKRPDFWWRESVDVDPISLEPLSDLEYAPFELGPHLFDGRVLAFYVVSTGTFLNPMSRDALGLEDCVALDDYLRAHELDEARVADAFRLSQLLAKDGDAGTDSAQSSAARNQRRQATAVLHNLFGFARYGDSLAAGRGGRGARDGASPGGNLRSAFDERDSDDERRGTAGGPAGYAQDLGHIYWLSHDRAHAAPSIPRAPPPEAQTVLIKNDGQPPALGRPARALLEPHRNISLRRRARRVDRPPQNIVKGREEPHAPAAEVRGRRQSLHKIRRGPELVLGLVFSVSRAQRR